MNYIYQVSIWENSLGGVTVYLTRPQGPDHYYRHIDKERAVRLLDLSQKTHRYIYRPFYKSFGIVATRKEVTHG